MHLVGPPILQQCLTSNRLPAGKPPFPAGERGSPAKKPLINPSVQLFLEVNPTPQTLTCLLHESWYYDPLTTLKLIFHLRTLREERESFLVAAHWLHKNHPINLACNLREFASFGSLTDFSEILYRLVNEKASEWKLSYHVGRLLGCCFFTVGSSGPRLDRPLCLVRCENEKPSEQVFETAPLSRKEIEREIAKRAVSKYVEDPTYRFLHERVSDIFSELLRSDVESLRCGDVEALSFASRECPSNCSSYDRHTLICESIAKKVFPRESNQDYLGIEEVHYVYRVRNRLRKEVLGPLRIALEGKTKPQKQGEAQYRKSLFTKKTYLKMKISEKNKKFTCYRIVLGMAQSTISQYFRPTPPLRNIYSWVNGKEGKELEWQSMNQATSKKSKLINSVAVCDVSKGMNETTRNVSISMGLLISALSSRPWKETVYGFHESPKPCKIKGGDLCSKVDFIEQLACTERVNIDAILDQILQVGVRLKLDREKMVKRVFVFTNKSFENSVNNCWGWNYAAAWKKYSNVGYFVPEIVFWNIENSKGDPPTTKNLSHNRLLRINGFSSSLFASFLDKEAVSKSDDTVEEAENLMKLTLSGKQYQSLVVLD